MIEKYKTRMVHIPLTELAEFAQLTESILNTLVDEGVYPRSADDETPHYGEDYWSRLDAFREKYLPTTK